MIQDLAARCPAFRFSKDEVRNILRDVADYKAPGVYVLSEYTKKHELAALEQKFGKSAGASKRLLCSWPRHIRKRLESLC